MSVERLEQIPGFSIDRVAAAAGDDPDVLRLENLDTDIPPPAAAVEATRAAMGRTTANSWLPFTGRDDLKRRRRGVIERRGGPRYDGPREIVITRGEGEAMLDALFCVTDPGRRGHPHRPDLRGHAQPRPPRRRGAAPRARCASSTAGGGSISTPSAPRVTDRTRVIFVNNASFPSGWVASDEEWEAIASTCRERDSGCSTGPATRACSSTAGRSVHPAALPGMRDRTVTVGARLRSSA